MFLMSLYVTLQQRQVPETMTRSESLEKLIQVGSISLFTIKRLYGLSDFLVHNQTIVWIIRLPCSQSNDCMDYQISLFTIKRLYGLSDCLVHNQTIVWIIRFPCSQSNDCMDYQIRRNNLLPSFTLRVSKVRICVIAVVSLLYCVFILIKKTI